MPMPMRSSSRRCSSSGSEMFWIWKSSSDRPRSVKSARAFWKTARASAVWFAAMSRKATRLPPK